MSAKSDTRKEQKQSDNREKENSDLKDSKEKGDKVVENGVESEEEEDPRVVSVLEGKLEDLPPLSSRIVRIFTSSTFTDTTTERNALMQNVYPKIKEYCRETHGLEFQVVDMRWGVRDEATDDHMTTELCMKEIDNCQRLSMGPNFVVFLGQKYGYRPIPTIIPASEYELLRNVIEEVEEDVKILDAWYKREDNSIPPVYILQPISTILVNFNNKRHQKLMEQDQGTWWEIMEKLQRMLRKAVRFLFKENKMDADQKHNYFMSVTEREVRRGVLNVDNTKDHCMAYIRDIENINLKLIKFARNFIDMIGRDTDAEANNLLATLRDDLLVEKMEGVNVAKFIVEWAGKEGIDTESHEEYLKQFCDHFLENIIMLVKRAVEANQKLSDLHVYSEVLQQSHTGGNFVKLFKGREREINRIQEYIMTDSNEALVLWGTSGCGKTSVLAKAYSMVSEWLAPDAEPVGCLRFLGTTPDSSSVIPLLTSLCQQIAYNSDQSLEDVPKELSPLSQYFKKVLECASKETPLIIFLDSVDNLFGVSGVNSLSWLPVTGLPPFCKIVLSTLPERKGIHKALQSLIPSANQFVEIPPLGEDLAAVVMKAWLERDGRGCTDQQWKLVSEALSRCNLPLYVKLVYDEVYRWKSYSPLKYTTLKHTINDSIHKLLDRIENQHGKILVSHALGYVTAAKGGLSEAELEDLLSLDEKVLNDVYQYHLPPVRRIPPLLWTRIRNDLPNYFVEREVDGVNVIEWYHKQFDDASRERYFKNLNFKSSMHAGLGDYFRGIWGGKPKPFEYSELQRQRFFLAETKGESDRKVPEQPLFWTDANGKVTRYNLRKLSEQPYHLLRGHDYETLYRECLFNVSWLTAKLSCMPLQSVLDDFEDALEYQFDKDVKLLVDALRLSASVLSRYPSMAGAQIVGRLLPYYHSYDKIKMLIDHCDSDGLKINALVPSYHCMHTPGGPLQYSLEGHPFAPFGIGITNDTSFLVSVSNIFIIWDLASGDVFQKIVPGIQGIMQNLCISPDDDTLIAYTNNDQVVIAHIRTGEFTLLAKPVDEDNIIGTAISRSHFTVWTPKIGYLYTISGELVSKFGMERDNSSLVHVDMGENNEDEQMMVWRTAADKAIAGVENEDDMVLEHENCDCEEFDFHSAIAFSKDKKTVYACIAISDDCIACYKRDDHRWQYQKTLASNYDKIFGLTLSNEENHLVASVALGYKLFDLKTDKIIEIKLPASIRNIPTRNSLSSLVVFTKNSEFLVAGVRQNLYVWDVKAGNLVKTLDAHFGRIICLSAVASPSVNKIVSSSIDKTIKVWNFDNILEQVHSIDRNEKPIDQISLAAYAYIGATTTRNCVGVWDIESGKLTKTLSNSAHSSIVTHAAITGDGRHVVSAESGNVIFWDVEKPKVLKMDVQKDIQQMILCDEGAKIHVLSKDGIGKGKCVCRSVPNGDTLFQFEYNMKNFKHAMLTSDQLFLIVPAIDKKGHEVLSVYHAKTGYVMYDMIPKYPNYLDFTQLVAMPKDPTQIALIDPEKGNIYDIKKRSFVRAIPKWNGVLSQNGRYGLYAPNTGGLDLLEIKSGKVAHTLIPRIAEGVFNTMTLFTKNDYHVVYYHSGRRSIRVFRVEDGVQIAEYVAHAEIRAIASTQGGLSIVCGAVDGSVVVLSVADPRYKANREFLLSLPSRQTPSENNESGAPLSNGLANGTTVKKFGTMAHVARMAAKAKGQKSRACVLS